MGEVRRVPAWLSPSLSATLTDEHCAAVGVYERIGRMVAMLLTHPDGYLHITRIESEGEHDSFTAIGGATGPQKRVGLGTLVESLEALTGLTIPFACSKCGRGDLIASDMSRKKSKLSGRGLLCKHCDRERQRFIAAERKAKG